MLAFHNLYCPHSVKQEYKEPVAKFFLLKLCPNKLARFLYFCILVVFVLPFVLRSQSQVLLFRSAILSCSFEPF